MTDTPQFIIDGERRGIQAAAGVISSGMIYCHAHGYTEDGDNCRPPDLSAYYGRAKVLVDSARMRTRGKHEKRPGGA